MVTVEKVQEFCWNAFRGYSDQNKKQLAKTLAGGQFERKQFGRNDAGNVTSLHSWIDSII